MSGAPKSLDELRQEIDVIDRQLHTLIQRRGGLAGEIAEIKKQNPLIGSAQAVKRFFCARLSNGMKANFRRVRYCGFGGK